MATRLTNDMRDRVALAALRHRFADPIKALRRQHATLANFVYGEYFSRVMMDINAMPEGWLPEDTSVAVRLGTSYTHLYFNGAAHNKDGFSFVEAHPEPVYRRMPAKDKGRVILQEDGASPITIRYDGIVDARRELLEQIKSTNASLSATLAKFWTVQKLLAGWPEIEPFTRGVAPAPASTALVVPVAKLNEALGLPVGNE